MCASAIRARFPGCRKPQLHRNFFGHEPHAVVRQAPGAKLLRLAPLHADDHVAVPRPGVFAIKFARQRRVVGMRMVPAHHVQPALARGLLRRAKILRRDGKAVARRIAASVYEREELLHFAPGLLIAAQQRAAALVRVRLRAVGANLFRQWGTQHEHCAPTHSISSQNLSLRYFSPESGKTVTITARAPRGSDRATWKQPTSAAAELGLTSKPSSRARRLTIR